MTACQGCGGRIYSTNKVGYCTRNNKCQAEAAKLRRWWQVNPKKVMLNAAKSRAKREGLPFNLTLEDIEAAWVDTCPVLGLPLKVNHGEAGPDSPSLDKIRPELGYVRGNIQVISRRANVMKHDASPDELLRFASWVQAEFAATKGGDADGGR